MSRGIAADYRGDHAAEERGTTRRPRRSSASSATPTHWTRSSATAGMRTSSPGDFESAERRASARSPTPPRAEPGCTQPRNHGLALALLGPARRSRGALPRDPRTARSTTDRSRRRSCSTGSRAWRSSPRAEPTICAARALGACRPQFARRPGTCSQRPSSAFHDELEPECLAGVSATTRFDRALERGRSAPVDAAIGLALARSVSPVEPSRAVAKRRAACTAFSTSSSDSVLRPACGCSASAPTRDRSGCRRGAGGMRRRPCACVPRTTSTP